MHYSLSKKDRWLGKKSCNTSSRSILWKVRPKKIYVQTDGGNFEQEATVFNYHDPVQDKVKQVWVRLGNVAGKGSKQVARGIQKQLQ